MLVSNASNHFNLTCVGGLLCYLYCIYLYIFDQLKMVTYSSKFFNIRPLFIENFETLFWVKWKINIIPACWWLLRIQIHIFIFCIKFLNSCKTLNPANISLSLKQTLWLFTQVSFITFGFCLKTNWRLFFI